MKRRLASLLLAMVMLFSVLPVGAFAAETDLTETAEQSTEPATSAEPAETPEDTEEPGETPTEPEEPEQPEHTHSYTAVVTKPTCTEAGSITYTCACGDSYTEVGDPATGHSPVTDPAVAATCTQDGKTEGSHCGTCGQTLTAQKTVAKLGHDYQNGVCTRCGDVATWLEAPVVTVTNVESSGKNRLNWDAVPGAVRYWIYCADQKDGTYERIYTVTGTQYTHTAAQAGSRYYYYVLAVAEDGTKSAPSATVNRLCNLARPTVTTENVPKTGKVKLSWKAIEGAVSYKVYCATAENGTYKLLKTVTGTTHTHNGGEAGVRYYYKVKAVAADTNANSAFSAVKTRICDLSRPVVTSSNVASSGKVRLTWDAVPGAVKYQVYRSTTGEEGSFSRVFTTEGTVYTHTSGEAGVRYYYQVKAVAADTNANSALSAVKTRICDLSRPTDLKITLSKWGKPKLTWSAVDGAVKYQVYRSTTGEADSYQRVFTASGTSYNNTGAEASTKYYYKVKAIAADTDANSAFSVVKSKTTTAGLKMKVVNGPLNVRTGPGGDYAAVASLSTGTVVRVEKTSNGWGKISSGWVSMDYLIEVLDTSGSYAYTYATYTTSAGSSTNRDTNLRVACKAINGTILMPGESFSFNGVVGERTPSKGYKPATVIVGNSYSTSYGGGVCQVSSTLFNAVLLGNLKINERNQHSMSVAYLPKGRDAMVNWGTSDFQFTNNSKYCIKIKASASGGTVTISLMTRESGVSPSSNVRLNVTQSGNTYTLKRSYKGNVNYTTRSTY